MYRDKAILDKAAAMKACGSITNECIPADADLAVVRAVVRATGARGMGDKDVTIAATTFVPPASLSAARVQLPSC